MDSPRPPCLGPSRPPFQSLPTSWSTADALGLCLWASYCRFPPIYIKDELLISSPLSRVRRFFGICISLFSPYIYRGKALKTREPRAGARGGSLRSRPEMVRDQSLPGVGCGLPWASSLRASRGPLPITVRASPITVLCILADLDVVLGPFCVPCLFVNPIIR